MSTTTIHSWRGDSTPGRRRHPTATAVYTTWRWPFFAAQAIAQLYFVKTLTGKNYQGVQYFFESSNNKTATSPSDRTLNRSIRNGIISFRVLSERERRAHGVHSASGDRFYISGAGVCGLPVPEALQCEHRRNSKEREVCPDRPQGETGRRQLKTHPISAFRRCIKTNIRCLPSRSID